MGSRQKRRIAATRSRFFAKMRPPRVFWAHFGSRKRYARSYARDFKMAFGPPTRLPVVICDFSKLRLWKSPYEFLDLYGRFYHRTTLIFRTADAHNILFKKKVWRLVFSAHCSMHCSPWSGASFAPIFRVCSQKLKKGQSIDCRRICRVDQRISRSKISTDTYRYDWESLLVREKNVFVSGWVKNRLRRYGAELPSTPCQRATEPTFENCSHLREKRGGADAFKKRPFIQEQMLSTHTVTKILYLFNKFIVFSQARARGRPYILRFVFLQKKLFSNLYWFFIETACHRILRHFKF
jgi:hypothetical protein